MRDKDAILLENVYSLILEGKRENINYLDKLFGDSFDEKKKQKVIESIIDTTTEPQGKPGHAPKLGQFIKDDLSKGGNGKVTAILNYYKLFMYLRNRGIQDISQIKSFDQFKEIVDKKQADVAIKQNRDNKDLTDNNLIDAKTVIDETNNTWDYLRLVELVADGLSKGFSANKTLDVYKIYAKLKTRKPLITIKDIDSFKLYTAKKIFDQLDKSKGKGDVPYLMKYTEEAYEQGEMLSDVVYHYDEYVKAGEEQEGQQPVDLTPLDELRAFNDFKEYVHLISPQKEEDVKTSGTKLEDQAIYEDDKIKVWRPDSTMQSIDYGYGLAGWMDWIKKGNGSQWCTTYTGPSNQYFNYRLSKGFLSTFYYVLIKDAAADKKNMAWFSSIQANEGKKFNFTPAPNGTQPNASWNEMINYAEKVTYKNNKIDLSAIKGKPDSSKIIKYDPNKILEDKKKAEELKDKDPVAYDKLLHPETNKFNSYEEIFAHIPLSEKEQNKFRLFDNLNNNFSITQFQQLDEQEQDEYIKMGYKISPQLWERLGESAKLTYLNGGGLMDPIIYPKLSNAQKSLWKTNRIAKLTLAVPNENENIELNNYDYELMLDPKNQNLFDAAIKNKRVVDQFLNYCSSQNITEENNPKIFELILASPKRCKIAIIAKINNGEKLEEIDPRYLEGVLKDEDEAEELVENLTQHGTNFGEIPPVLLNLILGSSLYSSKYLLHQLIVDEKPISDIDAKLINKGIEHVGTQQKVFGYLKKTNQLRGMYMHPEVSENIKDWIHYYDPEQYKSFRNEGQLKEKPKAEKKNKKEKPKVDDDDDGDLVF